MSIAIITKAAVTRYHDNGQAMASVEWIDHHGKPGRTQGACGWNGDKLDTHMSALFDRAKREGVSVKVEDW